MGELISNFKKKSMKKSFLLLCLTIASCSSKKDFIEINKNQTFKSTSSILFIFKGHTHLIYYYKDLAEKLKTEFNKKNIKVDFNYNLSAEKSFQIDLDNIPKEKYNSKNYNTFCSLSYSNPFISNGFSTKKNYDLNFSLKDSKTFVEYIKGKLRLKYSQTILTPSKHASKKLAKLFSE